MRRIALIPMTVTALLAVAACGGVSHTAADPFPPRPYTVDVTRVDPCTALTEGQRRHLDLQPGSASTAQGGTSRACTWPGDNGVGYTFQTLAVDASSATGADPTSTVMSIDGVGAVQSSPPAQGTGLPFCQVVLDVAEGASLRAQLQVSPQGLRRKQHTVESTCAQLRDVAAQMLANVRARQGQ